MLELLPEHAEAVEARLHALDWIDPDETLRSLRPAGEGNMNRTLRADLGARSVILKQSVPFVAKYPDIPAPAERIAVEAAFYRTLERTELARQMPALLGYDPDHRLLAFEDLGQAADFSDLYAGLGAPAELDVLVAWLGNLHALPVDSETAATFDNRAMRELNHAHIFEIPFASDNGLNLDQITPGLVDVAAELAADSALQARIVELGSRYLGQSPQPSTRVLLHGDYYPGSWLRDADRGARIIDPEFAFAGPAEFDVGVLLAHLRFAGVVDPVALLSGYRAPAGFSYLLADAFAAIEIMRRLLGVAQLPLPAELPAKVEWLADARAAIQAL